MSITFEPWPKTPRLFRDIIITEKLDGTNAAVIVADDGQVGAQSRKRLVTPEDDNFGFAAWVDQHATELSDLLGPGRHFGEWYGKGIQRGYGLDHKRFALFNTHRYAHVQTDKHAAYLNVDIVPVLYHGTFSQHAVDNALIGLKNGGSWAAPFTRPEGVVVYHTASNHTYKVLLENDNQPKGQAA